MLIRRAPKERDPWLCPAKFIRVPAMHTHRPGGARRPFIVISIPPSEAHTVAEIEKTGLENWIIGDISPRPTRLPHKWRLVRLTDVARLESGHTPSRRRPAYWNGGIPWVSLNDVDELDANELFQTKETISDLGLANSSARLLPAGTVIFSRTASIGKSTILGRPMSTTQDFANYICGSELHDRYLMYLFRYMKGTWKRLMAGSTHNTIYMPVFKSLQILLPPEEEQRTEVAPLVRTVFPLR